MHWFCKQGITAADGAKAVAGIALQVLKESSRKDIGSLKSAISAFIESEADTESAQRFQAAMKKLKIGDADSPLLHFASRILECIPRAVLAHTRGEEVEAWKLVASASLSSGAGLAEAVRMEERRRSAKSGHRKDHENQEAAWEWLDAHRAEYSGDKDRINAMISGNVVHVARGTLQRYVTAYNKDRRVQRAPAGRRKKVASGGEG